MSYVWRLRVSESGWCQVSAPADGARGGFDWRGRGQLNPRAFQAVHLGRPKHRNSSILRYTGKGITLLCYTNVVLNTCEIKFFEISIT